MGLFGTIGTALGGALPGVVGNFLGYKAEKKGIAENARQFEHSERRLREEFKQNLDLQKQFAKQGVRWRVEDAKEAGLHPLAAMGGSGAKFSPVASVGSGPKPSKHFAKANFMRGMGQDISRAVQATMAKKERLEVENMQLQNKLLDTQINGAIINNKKNAQIGPPLMGNGSMETDVQPSIYWEKNPNGSYTLRRKVMPMTVGAAVHESQDIVRDTRDLIGGLGPRKAPKGHYWYHNPTTNESWLRRKKPMYYLKKGIRKANEYTIPGLIKKTLFR